MNSKLWIKKALSTCSMVAILATYSMVALASDAKATGELIVNGNEVVTVNGEAAKSGRTIFTSSIISTPAEAGATLNLGKAGSIELAPNTSMSLSFDSNTVNVVLTSGAITNLRSAQAVTVDAGGNVSAANAGDTVSATAAKDDDKNKKKAAWWPFALIFGGATAAIIWAVTRNNGADLGGGTTVVSPNR